MSLIGMMDGGGGLKHDFEHESHEAGEEEFSLILFLAKMDTLKSGPCFRTLCRLLQKTISGLPTEILRHGN